MYGIIYKVTNKINNKIYIGQTINSLTRRKTNHYAAARTKKDTLFFHKAIRKYGKDNFIWEVLKQADTREELNELECFYIKQYNSNNSEYGYNMTAGGESYSEQAQKFWNNEEKSAEQRLELSNRMSEYWSNETNRKNHQQWMNSYYQTEVGKQQAKRHSNFMQEYYNGPNARRNKAKTSHWFVKAISPEGEENIYVSSKEPNLFFGKDIRLRAHLHDIGDVWVPTKHACKEVQGWRFEAIEKFEI